MIRVLFALQIEISLEMAWVVIGHVFLSAKRHTNDPF
jgi:hypothetical protein